MKPRSLTNSGTEHVAGRLPIWVREPAEESLVVDKRVRTTERQTRSGLVQLLAFLGPYNPFSTKKS